MRRNQQRLLGLGISILTVSILSPALLGQASPDSKAAAPVLSDWSDHHVIFSRPATAERAKRVEQDPRYWRQLGREAQAKLPGVGVEIKTDAMIPSLQPVSNALLGKDQGFVDWSEDMGTGASVGAGNYPAKVTFTTTVANCVRDFVVYSTGLLGSPTQASIVAYSNIYTGCGGTVPKVYWAYNTHATIATSPVFSLDGTQIAMVQTNTAPASILTLVKWASSTSESITSPLTLNFISATAYTTCTAPCRTTLALTALGIPVTDTNSSVFYDYGDDTAYVGDDSGFLHKFNPVFDGVLTEVKSDGWPVQVDTTTTPTPLTSPVYDSVTGNVFVSDLGGYLYWVHSTGTISAVQSGQLDFSNDDDGGPGIVQGPIVDSTAGVVYVFATDDGLASCPIGIGGTDCSAVYATSTSFTTGDIPGRAIVGTSGSTPNPMYIGAFDSTYRNSGNATGNLYVCGNTGGPPILYQVPITAGNFGALGSVNAGPVLAETTTSCSPVTDVYNPNASNGPTEWIFASADIEGVGVSSECADGCIYNFNDTPWKPSHAYAVGQEILVHSSVGLQIEVVSTAGMSGAGQPIWATTAGATTTDNTVHWLDQGVLTGPVLSGWVASHDYTARTEILDPNSNIELVTAKTGNGDSGSATPAFSLIAGDTITVGTPPNTVTWQNVGAIGTAALAASGGTSGIIIDNTVGSGTVAGASQVYFSTLSDQACGITGTGGCAVQASQAALK
jgi:hypothetical protein